MKKIISLFQRNYDTDKLVRNEIVPGAEWVINGEGIATRKWDGTSVMFKDGVLYKRYDAKNGKTPPEGFIPAQEPDLITGHWPGYLKVTSDKPEDKWFRLALQESNGIFEDGTYELCGPKFNSNQEKLDSHLFIKHGIHILSEFPRDFEGIKRELEWMDIEGIVWHHPDGRMVKIKKRDFGFNR